jgi:predicted transcriptional regulator with HTH domain
MSEVQASVVSENAEASQSMPEVQAGSLEPISPRSAIHQIYIELGILDYVVNAGEKLTARHQKALNTALALITKLWEANRGY